MHRYVWSVNICSLNLHLDGMTYEQDFFKQHIEARHVRSLSLYSESGRAYVRQERYTEYRQRGQSSGEP